MDEFFGKQSVIKAVWHNQEHPILQKLVESIHSSHLRRDPLGASLSTTKLWPAGCFFLFSLNEGMLTFRTFRGIMSIYGKPSMVYVGTGPSHTGRRKHKLSSERDDSNG